MGRTVSSNHLSRSAASVFLAHQTPLGGAVVSLFAQAGGFLLLVVRGFLEEHIWKRAKAERGVSSVAPVTRRRLGWRCLTRVAVRLNVTPGLLGEAFLVFVPVAGVALRLQTRAQRGHVGA